MQLHLPKCNKKVGEGIACATCKCTSIKYGRDKIGNQRYHCRTCHTTFLHNYKNKACEGHTNLNIILLIKEGCGIKSISRLLKMSATTVIKRIIYIAGRIMKPFMLMGKDYELDELCTYIRKKANLLWIVYAIRKDTKEVVDFSVGRRTNETLKRVTDTLILSNANKVYTDKLPQYRYLLPRKIHCTKQYGTNHIERKNLNLRIHLKRLNRRTICFTKSQAMLSACLKIYFWG